MPPDAVSPDGARTIAEVEGRYASLPLIKGELEVFAQDVIVQHISIRPGAYGRPKRSGNDHGLVSPYGLFEAADGQVAIAPSTNPSTGGEVRFSMASSREFISDTQYMLYVSCIYLQQTCHTRGVQQAESWTFLTNHAHVLLAIAAEPEIRVRDIAERVGITERAAHRIVAELVDAGCLTVANPE